MNIIQKRDVGIYVGRFNPLHRGHEANINRMLQRFNPDECIVFVGSAQSDKSLRNIFDFKERKAILKTLYPNINIIGLFDCPGDNDLWFSNLFAIVNLLKPYYVQKYLEPNQSDIELNPIFFGGSSEDTFWAMERGYQVDILNRYEKENKVSSSEIKDAVFRGDRITGLVNPAIEERIYNGIKYFWDRKYI